jgi:predicted nucleic acid-binding protein
MITYWDSSALVEAVENPDVRGLLTRGEHMTRPHALAELFSTLTKGVQFHYPPDDAYEVIKDLAKELDFIEVTAQDALGALKKAKAQGVRGARIHDLMHAEAALKCGAEELLTFDAAGFSSLNLPLNVREP